MLHLVAQVVASFAALWIGGRAVLADIELDGANAGIGNGGRALISFVCMFAVLAMIWMTF